jgi:hypothetical protein
MALFLGIALTGDLTLLPILCVITLPTWLLVTKAPPFEIESDGGLDKRFHTGPAGGPRRNPSTI